MGAGSGEPRTEGRESMELRIKDRERKRNVACREGLEDGRTTIGLRLENCSRTKINMEAVL